MHPYLQFSGNIGAGKSTLARMYAMQRGYLYLDEPVEHLTFVNDFYDNMGKWSFHHQLEFMLLKGRQVSQAFRASDGVCEDRSLAECLHVFAKRCFEEGWMDRREWQLLWMTYEHLSTVARAPDLRVYVRAPISTLSRRIAARNRSHEVGLNDQWLVKLEDSYAVWLSADTCPVIVVDSEHLDYTVGGPDRDHVVRIIDEAVQKHSQTRT